jgi:hypothetical protein
VCPCEALACFVGLNDCRHVQPPPHGLLFMWC